MYSHWRSLELSLIIILTGTWSYNHACPNTVAVPFICNSQSWLLAIFKPTEQSGI